MLAQIYQATLVQELALELAQNDPGVRAPGAMTDNEWISQQLQGYYAAGPQIAQGSAAVQAFAQTVERERAALLKAMPELADPRSTQPLGRIEGRTALRVDGPGPSGRLIIAPT